MPEFGVDTTPLYVFEIENTYMFSEYFDHTDLFEQLSPFYDDDSYRFEVPAEEFDDVRETPEDFFYEPMVVDSPEDFCVVKDKYSEHASILKQSVMSWERGEHRFFLMKSPLAVDEAVEQGATRLEETDLVLGL